VEILIDYFSRVAGYDWWRVIIELFSIGFVVYWVVDFLEGTKGERLFRGVFFILIAGFLVLNLIVERFGFARLQYLYNGFLIAVLIVAVAGFQPEIRRALIRIGQPGFGSGSSEKLAKTTEEIVAAVENLATAKIGAIITIEKKVALGEFIETGVKIDAKVTAELIRTIFYPGSPLHDMAVIIRGDKIVAARVQLPLAELGSLEDEDLASRHRAAIGLTAGSDAVCVVVSEETGIISIAQDGKLIRPLEGYQLRRLLASDSETAVRPTQRFWKLLKKNKHDSKQDLT